MPSSDGSNLATRQLLPRLPISKNGGATMSDDGSKETRDAEPKLYGTSGEPFRSDPQATQNQSDQLADFVKQQPFTAALVALVVGYLLSKVT
jgi:hypothetical protein